MKCGNLGTFLFEIPTFEKVFAMQNFDRGKERAIVLFSSFCAATKPTPHTPFPPFRTFDSEEFIYELKIDGFRSLAQERSRRTGFEKREQPSAVLLSWPIG
jgi:hypothetical protein